MHVPFILQVFAVHLNSIVGAEDVPVTIRTYRPNFIYLLGVLILES